LAKLCKLVFRLVASDSLNVILVHAHWTVCARASDIRQVLFQVGVNPLFEAIYAVSVRAFILFEMLRSPPLI